SDAASRVSPTRGPPVTEARPRRRARAPGPGWWLALPLCLFVLVFTVAPVLDTLRLSLTAKGTGGFPTVTHYRALAASDVFRAAVVNTVIVAVLSLVLQLALGLAVPLTLTPPLPAPPLLPT